MRTAGSGLLCGALFLHSVPLGAQPAPAQGTEAVELTWEAPANCPQRDVAQQRIRALAGPALRGAEPLRAEGRIVFVNRRYRLTLSVREKGELRERIIESASCTDLAGAAAVALGLLLRQRSAGDAAARSPDTPQPGSAAAAENGASRAKPEAPPRVEPSSGPSAPAPKTQPSSPNQPSSDSEEEPVPAPAPDEEPSGKRSWRFIVRAPVGTLYVGPLPKPGFGVGGALGIRWDGWSVAGAGHFVSAQTWLRPGGSDVGAEVGRFQADVSVCRGWSTGRVELAPCLVVGADRIEARGIGPNVSAQSQSSLAVFVGAAGAAHLYVFENLAIFAAVGLGVQTVRPRLVIQGLGEVGHVGPVQLSIGFGPEWRF